MRFTTFLAAFIYALPALADSVSSSSTEAAISTGSLITLTPTPTINAPIASGSVIESSPVSASGAPPAPTGVFQFAAPENVTICESLAFLWSFTSPSEIAMTLVVTNEPGILPDNLESADYSLVSATLTNDISSNSGIFVWESVDVPAGPYVVIAFNTESNFDGSVIESRSLPFYVLPGLDESCLNLNDPLDPVPSPTPTDSTGAASSVAAKHMSLSPGAIAGIVIGVVAAVVLAAAAILFPRYWRKRAERLRPQEGPYAKF